MTITLNGEKKQMPDNITVLGLLEFLKSSTSAWQWS